MSRTLLLAAALAATSALERGGTRKVLMLMSDTGGGHRASANALTQALQRQHPGKVEVQLMDIWSGSRVWPWSTAPRAYQYMGKRPSIWRALWYVSAWYPVRVPTRLLHDFSLRRRFKRQMALADPDLVVSVHPLCQHVPLSARAWLEKRSKKPVKFATVVTDLGSAHPMWFDGRVDACFVPTQRLVRLGRWHGVPRAKLVNHGLPLRRAFQKAPKNGRGPIRKAAARRKLGLETFQKTVLVTGGGDGFGSLEKIVEEVAGALSRSASTSGRPLQLAVICGRNAKVRAALAARDWAAEFPGLSVAVRGFVTDMETWMAASDVLLTKAGPGTIAEAAALGLPVLLTGFLPGQERGNVLWVQEKRIGDIETDPKKGADKVVEWIRDPTLLEEMAENARSSAKPQATDKIAEGLWDLLNGQEAKQPVVVA